MNDKYRDSNYGFVPLMCLFLFLFLVWMGL